MARAMDSKEGERQAEADGEKVDGLAQASLRQAIAE